MCGIAGVVAGPSADVHPSVAVRMAAALFHRGPDDGGDWIDESAGVGLAHRRLSIIDLSPGGRQPMVSRSGRYVISYNGEIYNFPDLRRTLEEEGEFFSTSSDTEVMLAAFERWGVVEATTRFVGMFAYAVWDVVDRELWLIRDRLGIKPLYWASAGGLFLFGSELSALEACPGWEREIDPQAVGGFLRWGYVPGPTSIYRQVKKLAPGSYLRFRRDRGPCSGVYWDLRDVARKGIARARDVDENAAIEEFSAVLGSAVRSEMISDVPLGAFLSGGIDSSLVVALMQEASTRPVKTFTVGFNDRDFDEAPYAREVARHLGTDHTELYVDPLTALDLVPQLGAIYDEPFADSSQVPTCLLSQLVRRYVTVALSGDGGDELFAGYTRYRWADLLNRRFGGLRPGIRAGIAGVVDMVPGQMWELAARVLPSSRRPVRVAERAEKFAAFLREPDGTGIYRRQHSQWVDPAAILPGLVELRDPRHDPSVDVDFPDLIPRMQFLDSVTYLPDDILTKVDRASMAYGLETRVPLLDHRLVELSWRLPLDLKTRGGVGKRLMRHLLDRYVPAGLVDRPKAGFSVPLAAWLRGPLRDWARALLDDLARENAIGLKIEPVERAWNRLQRGNEIPLHAIWCVLMLQSWLERPARAD